MINLVNIITDGTIDGTKVVVDGKLLLGVKSVSVNVDESQLESEVLVNFRILPKNLVLEKLVGGKEEQ